LSGTLVVGHPSSNPLGDFSVPSARSSLESGFGDDLLGCCSTLVVVEGQEGKPPVLAGELFGQHQIDGQQTCKAG